MIDRLVIASVQARPILGDILANEARAARLIGEAIAQGADIVLFPEMFLLGYPPEDLALKPAVTRDCKAALERLAACVTKGAVLMGTLWPSGGPRPYNAVALLADGEVRDLAFKVDLPNYGVFDEKRVFEPGHEPKVFDIAGVRIGVPVCEDIWSPAVCAAYPALGAQLMLVANGSPYRFTADDERMAVAKARAAETGLPMVYVNQAGGQDELVFDGASFSLSREGAVVQRLPMFEEALDLAVWRRGEGGWACESAGMAHWPSGEEEVYRAMVVGLRDYIEKSGFPGVVLGMSGGIDSALTAVVAADALGASRVRTVMMPSRYTSQDSLDDARSCSAALGAPYETIAIEPAVAAYGEMLSLTFEGRAPDTTEENIQARIRGVILMAISNKFGSMVLTTGNKSEMAVGYATLYGDMCGGYNVLKDVYKTEVYRIAAWRNANAPYGGAASPIPERILTRAPSAELRPDQTDQDSLPPYDVLDGILQGLVEREETVDQIVARGFDAATVTRIQGLLYASEYKRRQAPPGVKIGARAFGRDRRYPIVNRYRDRVGGDA